ncbi:MAG: radical SAM protein [Alphaproteobacteria bacterium]|nr:radical SAM protein [Alphaproteobacteria bacterium]
MPRVALYWNFTCRFRRPVFRGLMGTHEEIKTAPAPSARVETLGCRLNAWESAVISRHLRRLGAPMLVVNSCAVTAEAERQSRQTLRRLRRSNPGAKVVVTGCAATLAPERWAQMDGVDAVLVNGEKLNPNSWRALAIRLGLDPRDSDGDGDGDGDINGAEINDIGDIDDDDGALEAHFAAPSPARAFLEIQHGCDHRCTFCTIPFARGDNRSVSVERVIARARRLVDGGVREVILTGVDIASWGGDLENRRGLAFVVAQLLKSLPDLERLRLSSLDPAALDDDFFALLASEERLQPHLHLSAQAGDDLTLKRMKRRHLADDLVRIAERARRARPGLALGADVIAGFPTETREMFGRGADLFRALEIPFLHVFPYSPRAGTPASRMPQVAPDERRRRARSLRGLAAGLQRDYAARLAGERRRALCEGGGRARIGENLLVALPVDGEPGRIVEVALARNVSAAGAPLLAGTIVGV